MTDNITLIGMPASGKSTVGIVLAKALGYDFIDSDLLMQHQTGMTLHEYMEQNGIDKFLTLEENVNAGLSCHKTVIAPGGSICYSDKAMRHLKDIGTVIYLQVDYDMLEDRLHDMKARGVVLRDGQTLRDLYEERTKLYEQYADITINERGSTLENLVIKIVSLMHNT